MLLLALLWRWRSERLPLLLQALVGAATLAHLCGWLMFPIAVMDWQFQAWDLAYLILGACMFGALLRWHPFLAALYLVVCLVTVDEYRLMDECYCNRALANHLYWERMNLSIATDWLFALTLALRRLPQEQTPCQMK